MTKTFLDNYPEDQIKEMLFNMLQWVCANRYVWLEEFKQKMENLSPEQRRIVDWSSDGFD